MTLLPLLVLSGCTDPILPRDVEPTCETTIPSTWPDNGATGVYHRGAVEFTLSEPDPTAVVVADFDGVQSTRDGGLVVVYTPTEPLEPLTTYEVSLDYCRGTPSISFTTSALGSALMDDVDLVGRVYAADMTDLGLGHRLGQPRLHREVGGMARATPRNIPAEVLRGGTPARDVGRRRGTRLSLVS